MARATTNHFSGVLEPSDWAYATLDAGGLNLAVPLGDADGESSALSLPYKRTIEAVQVRVWIGGDGRLGDLGIELTSPHGTRSILQNAHNALQDSATANAMLLMSNAFNEEQSVSAGGNDQWTLRVVDVNGRQATDASHQAILANWSLRIYGR